MSMEKEVEEQYLTRLIDDYGYPVNQIQREYPYSEGRARYRFDIVILKEGKPYILVETKSKKKDFRRAYDQIGKYVKLLDFEFAVITNGIEDEAYQVVKNDYDTTLVRIPDIPSYGKTLAELGKVPKNNLIKAKSGQITSIIWNLLNEFRSSSGTPQEEAFKKILNLLILKAHDEKTKKGLFNANFDEPIENIRFRLGLLLEDAKSEYPTILEDVLDFEDRILKEVIFSFQKYSIIDSLKEVKGTKLPFEKVFGKYAFESTSPQKLVEFMIDVLQPEKGANFVDPACGVGGLLNYAASQGLNVTGIELLSDIAQYAKANLTLEGYAGKIITTDSLNLFQDNNFKELREYFDYAAIVPPFGAKITDKRLSNFKLGSNRSIQNTETLFLEQTYNLLRDSGRFTIVVPEGFLFGDYTYDARKFVLDNCKVKAIVNLPLGLFFPLSSIRTALLFLEKASKKDKSIQDKVFVAQIEDKTDFERVLRSYKDFENQKKIPDEKNIFITKLEDPRQMNFDYLQGRHKLEINKSVFPDWPQVPLQNIARFTTGIRMKKIIQNVYGSEASYLRAGDVDDLVLNVEQSEKIPIEKDYSKYYANPGDILFTRAGTVGRIALVQDHSLPLIIGSNVLRINILDKNRVLPEYLVAILRSDFGQTQIEMFTGGSTIKTISVSGIRQLLIPIPPLDEQRRVASQLNKIIETKLEAKKIQEDLKLKEQKMLTNLNKMVGGE